VAKTFFAVSNNRQPDVTMTALADITLGWFLTTKYVLWFYIMDGRLLCNEGINPEQR